VHQSPKQSWWQVPVIATQAVNNVGVAELYEQIECHRRALEQSGMLALKRSKQRRTDLLRTIEHRIMAQVVKQIEQDGQLAGYLEKVEKGQMDPYSAAKEILTNQTLIESWLRRVKRG